MSSFTLMSLHVYPSPFVLKSLTFFFLFSPEKVFLFLVLMLLVCLCSKYERNVTLIIITYTANSYQWIKTFNHCGLVVVCSRKAFIVDTCDLCECCGSVDQMWNGKYKYNTVDNLS